MSEDEARWERKLAARRALREEADDLFVWLCALEGGDAEIDGTEAHSEVWEWVYRQPQFNKAARDKVMRETL